MVENHTFITARIVQHDITVPPTPPPLPRHTDVNIGEHNHVLSVSDWLKAVQALSIVSIVISVMAGWFQVLAMRRTVRYAIEIALSSLAASGKLHTIFMYINYTTLLKIVLFRVRGYDSLRIFNNIECIFEFFVLSFHGQIV